jgi:hypothetical protein
MNRVGVEVGGVRLEVEQRVGGNVGQPVGEPRVGRPKERVVGVPIGAFAVASGRLGGCDPS